MSVIVMGMDYPTCCDECDEGLDCSGDYPVCRYTGEQRGYTFNTRARRMDKCPLRPLPEKHGDLVDRRTLMDEAKRLSGPITGDGWDNWGVYALIDRQPAIVEAEGE